MRIEQQGDVLIVDDGQPARWVVGLVAPICVGLFWMLLFNTFSAAVRLGIGALGFAATFLALAVLRAPRMAELDAAKHEVRLVIGWLPLLRRARTIPLASVGKVEIWHPMRWINRGHFWPALVLHSGEWVALSGFPRPRNRYAEVVERVRRVIAEPAATARASGH
jgi:hypothetical protein